MSVTAARGFRAAGVAAGLKARGGRDVALVVCDRPATAAAVLTSNRVQAAPVAVTRAAVADGCLRGVVVNSGGANACTGAAGLADAWEMAAVAAHEIGCAREDIAVASTGLIGVRLPLGLVRAGIREAAGRLATDGGRDAAMAIMTTDTVRKESTRAVLVDGATVTVGGMAKGAGMLAPALATMISVLTTDAEVSAEDLGVALRAAVSTTFDRVDSDGCTSTNDTVVLLASGCSGRRVRRGGAEWPVFTGALREVCADLAEQLVDDAEGATKRVAVRVTGAVDDTVALTAARAVARSALVKCAVHGEDPNWGRVLAAMGAATSRFDPDLVDVRFNRAPVCRGGVAAGDLTRARAALGGRQVEIGIDLHQGRGAATVLTTDLTASYVHENSAYSS
ncbi:MAG TPA: bifunctional glutamate N-acetyltransferase/amino-acid acetyltransferase ArgJ [Mycobacteriales bacterium]|nr:bifunctional glutamate N-acetyltransferase/amino-acid acetyltransferase ArgJ [Mycobacteriales bacterium]